MFPCFPFAELSTLHQDAASLLVRALNDYFKLVPMDPRDLTWHPAGAPEPFRLDLPLYFAEILGD